MTDVIYTHLWSVWFRDHIHTDSAGKLAIFPTREAAMRWTKEYGMPACKVRKLTLAN